MISQQKMLDKVKELSDELGGVSSYVIVLEKDGEAIACFDGTLEETCENLAEGFDYFVSKVAEDGMDREEAEEIQQTLQGCQSESVDSAFEPKRNLKLLA